MSLTLVGYLRTLGSQQIAGKHLLSASGEVLKYFKTV